MKSFRVYLFNSDIEDIESILVRRKYPLFYNEIEK